MLAAMIPTNKIKAATAVATDIASTIVPAPHFAVK